MSNDDQQNGGGRDGLGRRVSVRTRQDAQQQGPRQPSPGKVTLTSKLSPGRDPAVQRRSGPAATHTSAPRSQAAEGPVEDWMAVALRPDLHQAPIMRKSMNEIGYAGPDVASAPSAPASGGTAMPEAVQAKMEQSFGADFSAVRIHEGPQAPAIGALAYTQGTDIHFAPGQYAPSSQGGQELLGHELAHVVQQAQGRVGATMQTKGVAVNDDSALEREADQMGARAACGLPAGGAREQAHAGAGTLHDSAAPAGSLHATPAAVSMASAPVVQAKPAGEKPLEANAEKDAAALLRAFQGIGTDDEVVYRVLNQPSDMVQAIVRVYDAHYNRLTGKGLVEDLRNEFDHMGSQDDWHFVLGQLTRAGIAVPDAALRYQRQDPSAEHQGGMRIVASPDVRVAVPGTRITYTLAHGNQGLHSASAPYRYQWYVLNDPATSRMLGKPARVEGGDSYQTEARARFPGNHKVICKVTPRSGRGAGLPTFYEFPQTVVPEGQLAQDALQQAPDAVDPGRQLEVLQTFLRVLREAGKQPRSAPLDPATAQAYEKHIAALRKRLASTEGAERIPIRAVHVDREQARVSPLRAFVARTRASAGEPDQPGARETWRLVDITNPENRRLSGEYEGTGQDAREAILAALAAWDTKNRYAPGRIQLEVGAEAAGAPIAHTFQTDGMSFWDSIGEFFAAVGFWTGMGALAAGVITAVVPVPGMRVVSGLIWTSILTSTVATTIDLAQRHAEGMSTAREDAMDMLSIAGNILAGAWLSRARVLLNGQGGTKIGTGLLIGQLGTDGAQGIVLGIEYLEQYDRVMAIENPKQRTDALMELLRSAALTGGMLFLSVQGTKKDIGHLGTADAQGGPGRPGGTAPGGRGNLAAGSDAGATGRTGHATGSEPAGTSRETSPGPTRDRRLDDAQLERLSTALREAGLDARLLARLSDDTVARLAHPSVLSEIEQVARLQRSGRIIGLDDWIEFGSAKTEKDLGRVVGELREARRLVMDTAGAVVNVGGDARAPRDARTGQALQSFDLTVETPTGKVARSVEVTTVDAPVSQPDHITSGIRHASSKVLSRQMAGHPVPGYHDVTIRIQLLRSRRTGGGTLTIDPSGNISLATRNGTSISKGNLFDDVADHLSSIPSHQHLDRVSLVDATGGTLLAEFERAGAVWARIR